MKYHSLDASKTQRLELSDLSESIVTETAVEVTRSFIKTVVRMLMCFEGADLVDPLNATDWVPG